METVKTAISLRKPLMDEAEALAREMRLSRSGLFALALEEFIRRRENQHLLTRINEAVGEVPGPEEIVEKQARRRSHRRQVEGMW